MDAFNLEGLTQAEQDTGMSPGQWYRALSDEDQADDPAAGARAALTGAVREVSAFGPDVLFEFGLQRMLAGIAALRDDAGQSG
ncbi:hypothetical protein [Amycolatopsis sp. DG1A-15b]|uniref:hypothetical protein n=1 Tax=Amycolatopsis sp. DG1A-15b TaxID=3052846 RepID=UPI00255B5CA7|nr:hypothetical protein [Amycolatopsis sp. DG1A-15b]WIX85697.1 hypothetical protein QRY02_31355 [Amycolatopsis sp. DG1A-15b]